MKIEVIQGVMVYKLVESTPNDGSFEGEIPLATPVGSNYRIRVISTLSPAISDTIDGTFSII